MSVAKAIREEIANLDKSLVIAYQHMGYSYLKLGSGSATFHTATDTAKNLYDRKVTLESALEVVESEWVAKRVAKAS